jgi:hypothetical protein
LTLFLALPPPLIARPPSPPSPLYELVPSSIEPCELAAADGGKNSPCRKGSIGGVERKRASEAVIVAEVGREALWKEGGSGGGVLEMLAERRRAEATSFMRTICGIGGLLGLTAVVGLGVAEEEEGRGRTADDEFEAGGIGLDIEVNEVAPGRLAFEADVSVLGLDDGVGLDVVDGIRLDEEEEEEVVEVGGVGFDDLAVEEELEADAAE